jgi:hypothetical protein
MKNIESMPVRHLQRENEFQKKATAYSKDKSRRSSLPHPVDGGRYAQDPSARMPCHIPSFQTNDRNGVTSLVQRCGFLPDRAIDRHRQVFDDDKDRARRYVGRQNHCAYVRQ